MGIGMECGLEMACLAVIFVPQSAGDAPAYFEPHFAALSPLLNLLKSYPLVN